MKKYLFLLLIPLVVYAQVNISPNMGLPIPVPGVTPGPAWANNINASLTAIDSHNHSPGQGVQINPNGLDINTDLSFNANNATALRSTIFDPQTAVLSDPTDLGSLYVVDNELYYNDVTGGNQIQITLNGSVNAGAGSITGLPSGTASVSYAAGTYTFQSATATAANIDGRSYILRNAAASSFGLTLNPPAAMGANFSLTLPVLPLVTNLMSMDSSGNMAAVTNVDGTSLQWVSNTISIKDSGVTTAKINNLAVTTAKIDDQAVTLAKTGAGLMQPAATIYTSSGSLVVPTGVTRISVLGCGGGGGGGGAGGGSSGTGGSGGGGGSGAPVDLVSFTVVPGDTLTVTIGAGGAGGTAGIAGTKGLNGSNGAATTITGTGVDIYLSGGGFGGGGTSNNGVPSDTAQGSGLVGARGLSAATGGFAGGGGGGLGSGGNGAAPSTTASGEDGGMGAGGGGDGHGSTGSGGDGGRSFYVSTQAAGGTTGGATDSGGGGGGGGAALAVGGAGGNGSATPTAGAAAAANSCAGGGGGGAKNGVNGTSGAGGGGGSGKATLYYSQSS